MQGTSQLFLCIGLLVCINASVIFPYQQSTCSANDNQRRHFKSGSAVRKRENMDYHLQRLRRVPSSSSPQTPNGSYGMITGLKGLGPKGGGFLFLGAAAVHLANKLRSESVKRALDFWIHAGPIVLHYKFTKWFLTKTNAPLESESVISFSRL